ncbi:MAG: FTR1 family protein [Proteobacteria bacterium]|nr:FTR1 family protein [Pseudomonadota bacterium]
MFATLLLVFREVLEAALIVGIVAAATRGVATRARWIGSGIVLGVAGAALLALFAGRLADALSGSGQEWFNAGVLLAAVGLLGWHVVWMSRHARELTAQMQAIGREVTSGHRPLTALMMVVAIAVLREGSEIVLFGYGLFASGSSAAALGLGATLGLLAGVAMGFAIYFGLLRVPVRYFFSATNGLLVLVAAGMAANAAGFLTQADVLQRWTTPLWSTDWLLRDDSTIGKALHVLTGYTSQPTGMELLFYLATAALLLSGMRWAARPLARPTAPAAA